MVLRCLKKIKVKRARRFDAQEKLGNDFSMHAKLSMYMLFAKYDVDASGEIDANELYKMMLDALPIKSTAKVQDYDDQDFDLLADTGKKTYLNSLQGHDATMRSSTMHRHWITNTLKFPQYNE